MEIRARTLGPNWEGAYKIKKVLRKKSLQVGILGRDKSSKCITPQEVLLVNTKITFLLFKMLGKVLTDQVNISTKIENLKKTINKKFCQLGTHVIICTLSL